MFLKKRYIINILIAGLLLSVVIVAGCSNNNNNQPAQTVTLFKSEYCGCCGLYEKYLDKQDYNVNLEEMDDIDPIKDKYGIPADLRSCHTMVVGNYFVEGHIPMEAIEKLMTERPDIAGIAMPGMPSGSPGMPGAKKEPFVIMAVGKDGTISEFMRI